MATRLTLISHAATQAQRRAAFPLDESLEEREIAKIAAARWKAPRAQRILAAPERRAHETASALGLSAETTAELRECDYGSWHGRELSELQALDPEGLVAWLTDPLATPHGGESIVSLIARVARWIDGNMAPVHIIAVTHPPVIRAAIVHALQAPPQSFFRIDVAPLSITGLRFNGKAWMLRSTGLRLGSSIDEND